MPRQIIHKLVNFSDDSGMAELKAELKQWLKNVYESNKNSTINRTQGRRPS